MHRCAVRLGATSLSVLASEVAATLLFFWVPCLKTHPCVLQQTGGWTFSTAEGARLCSSNKFPPNEIARYKQRVLGKLPGQASFRHDHHPLHRHQPRRWLHVAGIALLPGTRLHARFAPGFGIHTQPPKQKHKLVCSTPQTSIVKPSVFELLRFGLPKGARMGSNNPRFDT